MKGENTFQFILYFLFLVISMLEKDDTTRRESVGRRSRSKNERVLRAIILARKRFVDDYEFVQHVNTILIAEKMVLMNEFGILGREKDEV